MQPDRAASYRGAPLQAARAGGDAARLRWADVAKGGAILGVVLWHVMIKHYELVEWSTPPPIERGLTVFVDSLIPVRMPLFFLVSGFLASRAIQRPWRTLLVTKSLNFYYLYLLWLLVQTVLLLALPSFDTESTASPLGLLAQATIDPSNLWYLYALALFFPIAKLLRAKPWIGVAVAAGVLVLVAALPVPDHIEDTGRNLIWFMLGAYFPAVVVWWTERLTVLRWAIVVVAFAGVAVGLYFVRENAVMFAAAALVGALFGLSNSVLISRSVPWLSRPLAAIGRQTLPVYVMHLPIVGAWNALAQGARVDALSANPVVAFLYPFMLTVAILALCLGIHRLLAPIAPALFGVPARLTRRLLNTPPNGTDPRATDSVQTGSLHTGSSVTDSPATGSPVTGPPETVRPGTVPPEPFRSGSSSRNRGSSSP